MTFHSLAQRIDVFPGLPDERRGFPCIPFKIIVQSSSIEDLPHCIDFADNPSHQLETKAIRVNQLFFNCWYCNLGGKQVKIHFQSTFSYLILLVLHILISDLQNKVMALAFVVRKYSHNTC